MGALDDTAAAIEALVTNLNQIQAILATGQARIKTARGELLGVLGPTLNAQIIQTTQATATAVQCLAEAASHLQLAVMSAASFAVDLGLSSPGKASTTLEVVPAGGSWTACSGPRPSTLSNVVTGDGTPNPSHFNAVAPGYELVDCADLPEAWMQALAQSFRPRPAGTRRATLGVYRYRDDDRSDPIAVSSNPRDPCVSRDLDFSRLTGIQGRPLSGTPKQAEDVEMRAAARLRQDERTWLTAVAQLLNRGETPPTRPARHLDVVIDNSVCGSRDFDQHGHLTCDRLLPGAIPVGDTMTVWGSVDGGQSFFRKTFTGTGSLIR